MVLVALLNSNSGWADDWKLEKNKNNVSIYSKQTDSGFKEIRVKTIVEAYPYSLVALLNDVEFSSNWIHNCIEVKILSQTSPTERLINSFFTAPWPLKNRDMDFYSKTTFIHNSVRIEISDRGDTTPLNPKYVRMQNMNGVWQASELENGKSEITYTGSGNPGGNIPVFIGNKELITSLFETFQNLKKVILLDQYQPVKITD